MVATAFSVVAAIFNPVLSSGPEGMRFNPAQLGFFERPGFACKLFDIGVGLDNNSFSFSQYNRYTGADLDEPAKTDILSSIPNSGVNVRASGYGRAAEFGYGTIAVTLQTTCQAEATVPRDVLDLVLSGNELDRPYSAEGAMAAAEVVFRSGVGAGTAIGTNGACGFSIHYLRGLYRAELTDCEASFLTTQGKMAAAGHTAYRTATGGNGIAFAAGVAYSWRAWRFSLACLDMSPGIFWTDGVEQGELSFRLDSANAYEIAQGGRFSYEEQLSAGEPFVTMVPIRTNLGVGRRFSDGLNGAVLVQPVWDVDPVSLREFRCGLVGEVWPLRWLPLGCEVAYQKGRGAVLGIDAALIRGRLALTLGMSDVAGLFLGAKGAELHLGIGYATFYQERPKRELPFLMHAFPK